MQATTIKLDGNLVMRLKRVKPRGQTLTGFVRSVLDAEVRRQRLRGAAEAYARLLRIHPDEAEAVDIWATAPLQRAPRPRRQK
jgi:hypothetical protein